MKALELLKKYEHNKWVYIDNKDVKEAISELEDLQSRSCYNCKYILDTNSAGNFCEYNDRCSDEGISVDFIRDIKDFWCNKWSAK